MDKREKVIQALENCTAEIKCRDCPWDECEGQHEHVELPKGLALKTLELLKAQEPRVMTLEEVLDMKFDDVVYLQVYPTNAVLSAIVIDVIPKLTEINVGVVQFRQGGGYNGINNAELNYYGKTWRCWTSRPTDEQREAVKWDGTVE